MFIFNYLKKKKKYHNERNYVILATHRYICNPLYHLIAIGK